MSSQPGISAPVVMLTASALVVGTVLISYTFWLLEHHTPAFLPTISNTWDYPPGSYISRWTVNLSCCLMTLNAIAVYLGTKQKFRDSRVKAHTLLPVALVAVFCLSWVGAICDNSALPSCRGANDIHSPLAVIFFVLYDLYLIVSVAQLHSKCAAFSLLVVCGLNKLHWLPSGLLGFPAAPQNQTLLAVFEWSDVGCIIATQMWVTLTVAKPYTVTIVDTTDLNNLETTPNIRTSLSANNLVVGAIGISLFSTLVPWAFALKQGIVQPGVLPVISDTWWHAPGDWISRWAVNLGCNFMHPLVLCIGAMNWKDKSSPSLKLAQLAVFGLSVVGCVSEKENDTLHTIAAGVWCLGFDVYMIASAAHTRLSSQTPALMLSAVAVSVMTKLRFTSYGTGVSAGQDLFALYEWSDLFAVYIFFVSTVVFDKQKRGSKFVLAIVEN
eukprot:TRINITY_DN6446_c0_g2_i1.p1 TRINITY_DN6446_c0_g2~~TRINITY_DN6446_c0_g2_i1.p1  ORF type:complete len:440 (-),score=87.86 TRINITY_DN6446_c0_g2_i1:262-1581(-)